MTQKTFRKQLEQIAPTGRAVAQLTARFDTDPTIRVPILNALREVGRTRFSDEVVASGYDDVLLEDFLTELMPREASIVMRREILDASGAHDRAFQGAVNPDSIEDMRFQQAVRHVWGNASELRASLAMLIESLERIIYPFNTILVTNFLADIADGGALKGIPFSKGLEAGQIAVHLEEIGALCLATTEAEYQERMRGLITRTSELEGEHFDGIFIKPSEVFADLIRQRLNPNVVGPRNDFLYETEAANRRFQERRTAEWAWVWPSRDSAIPVRMPAPQVARMMSMADRARIVRG